MEFYYMIVSVYVATQKKISSITLDSSIYIQLQVGACFNTPILDVRKDGTEFNYARDDSSKSNISARNPFYCELTGLYWIWKNVDSDIVGLCHYRRYFVSVWGVLLKKICKSLNVGILSRNQIIRYLSTNDLIVTKFHAKGGVYSQYSRGHHHEDLDRIRNIISVNYPEFLQAFDTVMRQKSYYACNMIIAPKDIINKYCSWLFSILFEAEKLIPYDSYDKYQQRVFGFLGERLLAVWIKKHNLKVKVCPIIITN